MPVSIPRLGAAGVAVGVLSGLLGIGGGVVLVPLLVLLMGMAQKRAQATSLAAITLTAVAGAASYGVAGDVALVPALVVAAGGIVGTLVGAELVHRMSERTLRIVFAAVMVVVAVRMALAPPVENAGELAHLDAPVLAGYVGAGLLMGLLSALVGIGGGVVMVPLLVLGFGFSPHEAQGTSLAVMVPVSLMGAWRHARRGYTDWRAGLILGVGGVLGAPLGALLAQAVPEVWLQRLFALLLVYSAVQLVLKARKR
ncbi:sulfite exporter TauE/SafE family protein [Georgenia satyanarayanai]|uniref:sulfite exporter TauE/SafE family protein n=1 Tax=Georgenia satyanarayanai TaxID=860221 RepID=UPI00203F3E33|nr:sulfite exporter TauE/SafE family protein [Georgenia satyanarayanai]MCM3661775.1 sulfite exporter TauE/SafE family protein [Georgenia satyanarayanai]